MLNDLSIDVGSNKIMEDFEVISQEGLENSNPEWPVRFVIGKRGFGPFNLTQ